jgi:Flp pilus assembly pilin Flp
MVFYNVIGGIRKPLRFITKENLVTTAIVPLEFTLVVKRMFPKWKDFRRNDRGQDLAEYCLITAAIALVGLVLFVHVSGGLQGLWGAANSTIAAGGSAAAGDAPAAASAAGDHGGNHDGHDPGDHH